MKKVILLLSFVFLTMHMLGQNVTIDEIAYNLNSQTKTTEVTNNTSKSFSGVIVIPESVNCSGEAYSVRSIGKTMISMPQRRQVKSAARPTLN